jgi:hypothetical protein
MYPCNPKTQEAEQENHKFQKFKARPCLKKKKEREVLTCDLKEELSDRGNNTC